MTKRRKRMICLVLALGLMAAGIIAERSRAVLDFHEYTVGYADNRAHYTLYRGGHLVRRCLAARPIAEHRVPAVEPEIIGGDVILYHFTEKENAALESLREDMKAFRTDPSWWQIGAIWRRKVVPVLPVMDLCCLTEEECDDLRALAEGTSSLPYSLESNGRSRVYGWYWGWREAKTGDGKESPVWLSLKLQDLTNGKTGRNLSPRYGVRLDPWGEIPVSEALWGIPICAAVLLFAALIVRRIRKKRRYRRPDR